MKTTEELKKNNKKTLYTAVGTVILGITGIFCVTLSSTKLENWILGSKVNLHGGLNITNSSVNFVTDFDCTNDIKTYEAKYSGTYKLEVWGAQGGTTQGYAGGYGGYAYGETNLDKNEKLYVGVGGAGTGATYQGQSLVGGYNGGGNVTGNPSVNHFAGSRWRSNAYC